MLDFLSTMMFCIRLIDILNKVRLIVKRIFGVEDGRRTNAWAPACGERLEARADSRRRAKGVRVGGSRWSIIAADCDSKEAIYAEVLRDSLTSLGQAVGRAVARTKKPVDQLRAAAMAFFRYYADNPRDLDLGFYLFRGGMRPKGLGKERDEMLNAALEAALHPIAKAAEALGTRAGDARLLMADTFAHAAGLLLLAHTGRIRMFGASAPNLMERYVEAAISGLGGGEKK
jgi:AcrR family transcriptional regulator